MQATTDKSFELPTHSKRLIYFNISHTTALAPELDIDITGHKGQDEKNAGFTGGMAENHSGSTRG